MTLPMPSRYARIHLPVVTDHEPRPQSLEECRPCKHCQEFARSTRRLPAALPCGHNPDTAHFRARPCAFVGCEKHVYLDVNDANGAIKLNFPHLEITDMTVTCSEDFAGAGPHTLEAVGEVTNCTRERVRQIEQRSIKKLRRAVPSDDDE